MPASSTLNRVEPLGTAASELMASLVTCSVGLAVIRSISNSGE